MTYLLFFLDLDPLPPCHCKPDATYQYSRPPLLPPPTADVIFDAPLGIFIASLTPPSYYLHLAATTFFLVVPFLTPLSLHSC